MLNGVSTLGITVGYAVEATAGTRPTSGYTVLTEIRDIPAVANTPGTIDATPLEETVMFRMLAGLADADNIALVANNSDALQTAWEACVSAANTANADGKACWFEFKHPTLTKSFFVSGMPQPLGFAGAAVNSVLDLTLNIVPNGCDRWQTKSS